MNRAPRNWQDAAASVLLYGIATLAIAGFVANIIIWSQS